MDTISGFADSYEIFNTSTTSFFAAPASTDNTESSIDYPLEFLTGPDVSALQLLSNSLESVFNSPEAFYSDAKLVLAGGQEISFHCCLLSVRSPVFRNALAAAAAAEKEKNSTAAVKLELKEIARDYEVGYDSVMTVLSYIYTGRVKPRPKGVSDCADGNCHHVACRPAVEFMVETLYLAFIFEIPELVTLYQRHLLEVVQKVIIEDTLIILKVAHICGKTCQKLFERCKEIIVNSDIDLVSLEKSLPQHIVKEITEIRKEIGLETPEVDKHVSNILKALESDDVELVKLLLTEGHTNLDDAYALHFAVAYCDVKTVIDLLNLELADVNRRNPRGYTVLHVAAMRKDPKLIGSLLTKGANASKTCSEGRTPLLIAKQVTMAAEYNNVTERCKLAFKGRLCVEILEQAEKGVPFPRDVSPSLGMAAEELNMRLLDLDIRVALVRRIFPMEAQIAMDIAEMKGICEFVASSLEPEIGHYKEHQSKLRTLSKTVEFGKSFFPRCSAVIDEIMNCEDLTQLAFEEEDTPEKRLQKKQRFMEIQETMMKAFTEDKQEFGNSSKSTSKKRSNGKLSNRRKVKP